MSSQGAEQPDCAAHAAEQVAMLLQGREVYGIGTILKLYATALPQLSFVALDHGPMVDWLKSNGNRVDVVPGLADFPAGVSAVRTLLQLPEIFAQARRDAARIDELIRPRGIRIVHAHWRAQHITAGFLRKRGYRTVWQINHNITRSRLFGVGVQLNHRMAKWGADLLLPASDFIRSHWDGCGVPSRTIRNAAVPIFTQSNELGAQPVRCIIAGRLEEEKGHHLAIEAVIRARMAGENVELDIYGDPLEGNAYVDELRGRVAEAGCAETIRFLGFRADLRQLHQQYHLGLQCRVNPEPCSLWVCETLVDGLPLIGSATGGTPELIEDGETGLLFRPGDLDDLARKLIQLASDPDRLRGMRAKAFSRGQRMFTLDRYGSETLEAYQTLTPMEC